MEPNSQQPLSDIEATCCDCKDTFTITVRDQIFLKKQGWELFKRCLKCRRLKKVASFGSGAKRSYDEPQLPPRSPKRV